MVVRSIVVSRWLLVISRWLVLIIVVLSLCVNVLADVKDNAPNLKIGQVIEYNGRDWVVENITPKKLVILCPNYDYSKFFSKSNWGWFYGTDKCISVPLSVLFPKQTTPSSPVTPSRPSIENMPDSEVIKLATNAKYLNNLSAKDFNKLYKRVLEISVMHPTKKNVAAYMFMTNFLRLKALVFAHAVTDYVLANPKYNMAAKTSGTTSWSRHEYVKVSKERRSSFVREHSKDMGLMVFIKNGCPYCMEQMHVLSWFKADYGVDVLLVSMNGCPQNTMGLMCVTKPEAFQIYGIQYEPTIFLVIRGKNGKPSMFPVGAGLTTEQDLLNRVYYYANTYYNPQERYTDKNFLHLLEEGK